jgi:GDP-L-fucose synthase
MKTKILLLGGYGFLGSNIHNEFINDQNYEIFCESRRTDCDMLNYEKLYQKIKTIMPNIIIYCSANVGSVNYVTNYAADVIDNNLNMCLNLYKSVKNINKDILIINPLANCSYPGNIDIQHESMWWDGKIHESVESFGMFKKTSFIISECYKKQYGIKTINIMLGGGYGEGDHTDEEKTHAMNGIILRMIKSKKNNENKFVVWGTGSPIREWVYMSDVAKIIKEVIDKNMYNIPNPLNIGQNNGISILDIVNIVKEELNYNGKIIFDTTKQDGAPKKVLGSTLFDQFFPNFKFTNHNDGIKKTIKYYLEKYESNSIDL